jgi:RNA polymerase sigma-70 factor (ECF subfamily)
MSLPAGQPAPDVHPQRDAEPAADPPGDVSLMAALAAGDRQALGQLYDRQGPLLLALGLRILGDRAVAEDVLHDVFLEAWHHAREFDPTRGTVRAWLVTRMRSRCLDRRTTATRQQRLAEDAARQQEATASPDEGAPVDGARVRTQLGVLAPDLAAVLELAYFDGLSSSEIARRLQIPIGTVKSRMARALESLRQALLGPGGHT